MVSVWQPNKESENIYVCGDIHGLSHQLKRILKRILPLRTGKIKDKLILLGDYCDRGCNSPEVLDILIALKKKYGEQVVCIRGNHESMMADSVHLGAAFPSKFDFWYVNGGQQTLLSYLSRYPNLREAMNEPHKFNPSRLKDIIPKEHMEFLENYLVDYYEDEKILACHGGIDPTRPVKDQNPENIYFDRSLFQYVKNAANNGDKLPWDKFVLCGHNTDMSGKPFVYENYAMLDCSATDTLIVFEANSKTGFKAQKDLNRLVKI